MSVGLPDPSPVRPEVSEHLPAVIPPRAHRPPAVAAADLVAAFLAGRSPHTMRAYARDLDDFARYLGSPSAASAVESLLGSGPGNANAIALGYKADLLARGLAPATIARRLAALRSMVKLGRTLGRVAWSLEIESPHAEALKDTAGPGDAGWRAILATSKRAAAGGDPRSVRDLAIVRLLHDTGLRRGELVGIDRADLDLAAGKVAIVGKGRLEREGITLPGPVRRALADWVGLRGDHPGPLFVRTDRAAGAYPPGRLTADAVYKLVGALGRRAGLTRRVRPHGLRHRAITAVLDHNGGDLRAAARFSRHRDLRTLSKYDDNREDLAGRMAGLISED